MFLKEIFSWCLKSSKRYIFIFRRIHNPDVPKQWIQIAPVPILLTGAIWKQKNILQQESVVAGKNSPYVLFCNFEAISGLGSWKEKSDI